MDRAVNLSCFRKIGRAETALLLLQERDTGGAGKILVRANRGVKAHGEDQEFEGNHGHQNRTPPELFPPDKHQTT